jgi:hypothetical protein
MQLTSSGAALAITRLGEHTEKAMLCSEAHSLQLREILIKLWKVFQGVRLRQDRDLLPTRSFRRVSAAEYRQWPFGQMSPNPLLNAAGPVDPAAAAILAALPAHIESTPEPTKKENGNEDDHRL